jgi:hypothetical protein
MNLFAPPLSGEREINIGMVIEGNAYFIADFPRYLAMQPDQLDETISHLQQLRRQTFSRFIRHKTVPWFGASCAVLVGAIIVNPSQQPSLGLGIATLAWIVGAVLPSLYVMTKQREDLFNALTLLKEEIKKAKAARATK